jgi:hypothetical protein
MNRYSSGEDFTQVPAGGWDNYTLTTYIWSDPNKGWSKILNARQKIASLGLAGSKIHLEGGFAVRSLRQTYPDTLRPKPRDVTGVEGEVKEAWPGIGLESVRILVRTRASLWPPKLPYYYHVNSDEVAFHIEP